MYIEYCKPLIVFLLACLQGCAFACMASSAKESNDPVLAKPHVNSSRSKATASSKAGSQKTRVAKPLKVPKVEVSKTITRRTLTVSQWFAGYDQIRRDAEMTMADKWQSMLLQAKKPEPKNAALAIRMSKKYGRALSDMKRLGSTPETKALQVGYIEYFGSARQLFDDYLIAQNAVPFTNQSLVPTKKKLEVLDKKNKRMDDTLRREYIIKKHRHS